MSSSKAYVYNQIRAKNSRNFTMKRMRHPFAKLFVFVLAVIILTIYLLLWIVGHPCLTDLNKEQAYVNAYGPRFLSSDKYKETDNNIDDSIQNDYTYENWNKHYGNMFEEWFSAAQNKFIWNYPISNVIIRNK